MSRQPAWLKEPEVQAVFTVIREAGGEARAVGGCVRDSLLGKEGGDVDIASTLLPEKITQLAEKKKWKAVPTGIDHGTVTLVLPSKRPIEVTTLRRDVQSHGRRATVAFTDRFEEDAARRDFTINALYMDAKGVITDFFGGQEDLKAHRLRFIGEATLRIEEDALRILRYFRFLATLGWQAEPAAVKACTAYAPMIETLSGERIQQEMKKLLSAHNPTHALEQMRKTGLPRLLTGNEWNMNVLGGLLQHESQYRSPLNPWARLAALSAKADAVAERWKLSRADRDQLAFLCEAKAKDAAHVKEYLRHYPRDWVKSAVLLRSDDAALVDLTRNWLVPTFPVSAGDLMARGFGKGPELGKKLKEIEQRWIKSDYALSKDELLKGA